MTRGRLSAASDDRAVELLRHGVVVVLVGQILERQLS
jgi:hypothetical protein